MAYKLVAYKKIILIVNDEHTKPRFKRKLRGLTLKTAHAPNFS